MPFFNFKCSECGEINEILVGSTVGSDSGKKCPSCGAEDALEKLFSVSGVSGEVIGGYEYEYGKKSWKRNGSQIDKAAILSGDKDPY